VLEGLKDRKIAIAGGALAALAAVGVAIAAGTHRISPQADDSAVAVGEARQAGLTVALPPAISDRIYGAPQAAGRPIVVIDPGHGGSDPGAISVSGEISEKQLTLELARELRDTLVKRGRVRVAMTRDDDRYLPLEQRADVARRTGASLFISLHMDSAPNPLARGASIYSLSDVASDAEAARFAEVENRGVHTEDAGGSVPAMLSDLAMRDQMVNSAEFATRVKLKSAGRFDMRPEAHRFAAFHVLRRADTPAVLFEAGYISNADDEVLLRTPEHRSAIVLALAQAIEADVAASAHR
jgi:N-acetylmuramoyl-L-alanine amidase